MNKMKNFYNKNSVLYLHVTDECNLNCSHCYGRKNLKKGIMNFEKVKQYYEKIEETFGNDKFNKLFLHGGEPLLLGHKNTYKILNYFKNKKFKYLSIQTNSTLIDDKFIKIFNKFIMTVSTSYDYNVNRVYNVSNLQYLRTHLKKFGVVITITKDFLNNNPIQQIYDKIIPINYDYINLELFKPSSVLDLNDMPSSESVYNFYKKFYKLFNNKFERITPLIHYLNGMNGVCMNSMCYEKFLSINNSGKLYHCNFLASADILPFGNINESENINPYKNYDIFKSWNVGGCPFRTALNNDIYDPYHEIPEKFRNDFIK